MLAFKTREVDWRAIVPQAGAQPLERPASTGWLRGRFTFVQAFPAERCSAKLMRPDGTVVAEAPYDKKQMSVLTAPREKTAAPEVWSVVFPRVEEDARFRVGAPALPIVATGSPEMALAPR